MPIVSLGQHDLEYRLIEPSRPVPPIVFLHEGLGSVSHWREFPHLLCRALDRPGLVYSRIGYGRSSPIQLPRRLDYFRHEGEEMLPALLDRLDIDQAVLFGHSDGASIALVAAAADPRVTGLVLEAPHLFTEEKGLDAIREAVRAYRTQDLRERLAKHHADVDGAFWGWARAWLDPAFLHPDLVRVPADIACPILVLQGTADPYGTLAHAEAIAATAAGPVTIVELAGVGHAPHHDVPDEVVAATLSFLDGRW